MSYRNGTTATALQLPSPFPFTRRRRDDPMSLSNLVHPPSPDSRPHGRVAQLDRVPRDSRHAPHSYPSAYTPCSPTMHQAVPYKHYELYREPYDGSNSSTYSPPTTLSSILQRCQRPCELHSSVESRNRVARSTTLSHRVHPQQKEIGFGKFENGKWFCTYMQLASNSLCVSWEDGYGSWHDLVRHANTEHGPEEVDLIDRGMLNFQSAQWIKSEEQRSNIKATVVSMVCPRCGTKFASNRFDSLERHVRNGACRRLQEKRMVKQLNSTTVHKKKGGKTAAEHTRR